MSEYQYYEFLALDKPLTGEQRAELRKLSSRAEITATRFVNEYNYGDFRGNPEKLMERYFDAFCYLANWGTRRLMFRFPRALLDAEAARKYCHTDAASVIVTDDHVIISLYLDRDPGDWVEGDGQLGTMVQARSDLAAGDLRLLYLAWLLSVQWPDEADEADEADEDNEDEIEPPVPAGLGNLSAPLQAIADFLEIDEDLIAVAAGASPPAEEPSDDGLAEWIASLPATEKDSFLTMVADGEGVLVQALLLRRFRADAAGPASHSSPGRTAAELLEAAQTRAEERKKAEEQRLREAQARKAAAKAAAYAKRLDDLAAIGEAAWKQVDDMIATKKTSEYDQAVALLRDLRALAERQGEAETAAFKKRMLDLRAQYPTRPGLQSRLDEAGFPG
ncbi:MAG: hypothetical protein ACRDOH_07925 [Streptosporangiaceae bacterium]